MKFRSQFVLFFQSLIAIYEEDSGGARNASSRRQRNSRWHEREPMLCFDPLRSSGDVRCKSEEGIFRICNGRIGLGSS